MVKKIKEFYGKYKSAIWFFSGAPVGAAVSTYFSMYEYQGRQFKAWLQQWGAEHPMNTILVSALLVIIVVVATMLNDMCKKYNAIDAKTATMVRFPVTNAGNVTFGFVNNHPEKNVSIKIDFVKVRNPSDGESFRLCKQMLAGKVIRRGDHGDIIVCDIPNTPDQVVVGLMGKICYDGETPLHYEVNFA